MSQNHVKRTATALGQVIAEIEHLRAHPRIQQRTWVANAARWLPVLHETKAQLEDLSEPLTESQQAIWEALARLGLHIHRRENAKWYYDWNGEDAKSGYDTPAQAVESALREKMR